MVLYSLVMNFGFARWGEALRVLGHSEKNCPEKSAIKKGAKSVKSCQVRPVARSAGNKKGELRSVRLSELVEAAGIEPASASTPP
jgi:hypothetical protein